MVGPKRMGFGSFTVAGQVIRSDIADNRIHSEVSRRIDAPWDFQEQSSIIARVERNLEYIGHLVALRAWYTDVRKRRLSVDQASSHLGMTVDAAIGLLDSSIDERWTRLRQFLGTPGRSLHPIQLPAIPCPLLLAEPHSKLDHVDWVRTLSSEDVKVGVSGFRKLWIPLLAQIGCRNPDLHSRVKSSTIVRRFDFNAEGAAEPSANQPSALSQTNGAHVIRPPLG